MKHDGNIPSLKDVVAQIKNDGSHFLYVDRFMKLAHKENGDLNLEHDPLIEACKFMVLMQESKEDLK